MHGKLKRLRQLFVLGAVLGLLIFAFTGCSIDQAGSENSEEGSRIYTVADPTGDWGFPAPYLHYQRGPGYVRMSFVFDTLVWKDEKGLVPALAKNWKYIENEKAFVFNLQKDVKWHDGEKFTAGDVVFTFNYTKEHPYAWVDNTIVKKAEALSDYKVKIYLAKPYAPFLTSVAGTLPILPRHIYKDIEKPKEYADMKAAVGTGPFKLVDYNREHGTYLYEANASYYLGKPAVDKLKFVKISDQMAPTALKNGNVDATSLQPELVKEFKKEGFTVIGGLHQWNAKLMINHKKAPLDSKKFRQALAYAINREELVQISQRGHAVAGNPGLLSPDSEWYNSNVPQYKYSPDTAGKFLEDLEYKKKNGYYMKDGKILEFELLVKQRFERDAELIKKQLDKVGIKVNLRGLEDKTIDTRVQGWNFDLALSGHGGLGGDPEILNKVILGKGFNSARYTNNEKLTGLLKEQVVEMDAEKRKKIVAAAQKEYAEDLPALTLYYPTSYWAHNNKANLYYTPGGIASGIPIPLNKMSFIDN